MLRLLLDHGSAAAEQLVADESRELNVDLIDECTSCVMWVRKLTVLVLVLRPLNKI